MEVVVLEKGVLRFLIGKNKNVYLYRLNEKNEWIKVKNNDYVFDVFKEIIEVFYFSEEGIWLFVFNVENLILNFKLILIKENISLYI